MRNVLLLLIVMVSLFSMAATAKTINVSVPINDKADTIVKDEARKKAIWEAALHYPALVSGVESVDANGKFSSEITALTAGAIELETIREEWSRGENQYTLVANASVNESLSIEMIKGVQSNLELQKRLKRVYQDLDKAVRTDSATIEAFEQGMDDVRLVSSVIYRRDSYKASLAAREAMERHFNSTVLRKIIQPLYDNVTFELYDFDDEKVLYKTNLLSLGRTIDLSQYGKHCSVKVKKKFGEHSHDITMSGCTLHEWYEGTKFAEDMTLPFQFVTTGYVERRSGQVVLKFTKLSSLWGKTKTYKDMVATPELVYDNFAIAF